MRYLLRGVSVCENIIPPCLSRIADTNFKCPRRGKAIFWHRLFTEVPIYLSSGHGLHLRWCSGAGGPEPRGWFEWSTWPRVSERGRGCEGAGGARGGNGKGWWPGEGRGRSSAVTTLQVLVPVELRSDPQTPQTWDYWTPSAGDNMNLTYLHTWKTCSDNIIDIVITNCEKSLHNIAREYIRIHGVRGIVTLNFCSC